MVAQPVTQTGCDTHPHSVTMATGRVSKRVRMFDADGDDGDQGQAAAGPAMPAATLQQLTERVHALEVAHRREAIWWKEAGDVINEHGKEIDELHGEAMQYNDNLQLVAADAKEYTNALVGIAWGRSRWSRRAP